MGEIKFDKKLGIRTTGIKEWPGDEKEYNRCESTPYKALETLFKYYAIEETDKLVDFGSGRGRVAFYVHNRFEIPITGIEAQDDIIDDAYDNKKRYRLQAKDIEAPIYFEYGLAENYTIKKEDNIFFFFNPFSEKIFKKVFDNILASLEEEERDADIILYYPMPRFKKIVERTEKFEIHNKIPVPKSKDNKEKFVIYRYIREE